jgi:predicted ATPase
MLRTASERPVATTNPLGGCEHIIEAVPRLSETHLTRCPALSVLATSREPLGVPGDTVRPVEPTPVTEAFRLFGERGTPVRPDFTLAEAPEALAEVCRRLDGPPLAIESAATAARRP